MTSKTMEYNSEIEPARGMTFLQDFVEILNLEKMLIFIM